MTKSNKIPWSQKRTCTHKLRSALPISACGIACLWEMWKKGESFFARARTFSPQKNSTAAGLCTSFFVADFVLFACLLWWPAGPTVVLLAPHDAFFFLDFVHVAAWFFWCRVFTSLTPLVFGAGSCTYGLMLKSRSIFFVVAAALQEQSAPPPRHRQSAAQGFPRVSPALPALLSQSRRLPARSPRLPALHSQPESFSKNNTSKYFFQ